MDIAAGSYFVLVRGVRCEHILYSEMTLMPDRLSVDFRRRHE